MKVKLSVLDRVTLLGLLPSMENYATIKVVTELHTQLGIGGKEGKEIEFKVEGDRVTWNPRKEKEKEFDFGKFETDIIVDALEKADKEKKLEPRHVPLYDKFIK